MKPEFPIGIAGAGRVARAFGRLLAENGAAALVAARTPESARLAAGFIGGGARAASLPELAGCARVLVCVSDSALEPVAAQMAGAGGVFLHTCGARGAGALAGLGPAAAAGALHPLQTFPSLTAGSAPLKGIAFGVSGAPAALAWARELVAMAGGRALELEDSARPAYHAAAVMASNYLVTLLAAAEEAFCAAGLERAGALAALAPLVAASVENTLRAGPVEALTGPVRRGDAATVAAHLAALKARPDLAQLYLVCGRATLELARRGGLNPEAAAAVKAIFDNES